MKPGFIAKLLAAYGIRKANEVLKPDKTDGYDKFMEQYSDDRIVAYSPKEAEQLKRFEGCINCGLCYHNCPAIQVVSHDAYAGPRSIATSISRSPVDFWTARDMIYYCTECGACSAICPQKVPVHDLVKMIRAKIGLQKDGIVPKAHDMLKQAVMEKGNVYMSDPNPDWGRYADKAEVVLFVGCVGRFREEKSLEATMRTLDILGVDWTMIEEVCCGGAFELVGLDAEQDLLDINLAAVRARGGRKFVTTCPRCYLTFKDAGWAEHGIEVVHILQYLLELDWEVDGGGRKATYHDPCDLGRHAGIYEEPRELIRRMGLELVEMPYNRDQAKCCGAGAGVRGAFLKESIAMARDRLGQALDTGVDLFLTECSSCVHNFKNAKKRRQQIEIFAISEYLEKLLVEKGAGVRA